ncbi:HAD hydrolase family protein [Promicromonospora sp. AC04]|uniref:HAD hydrolase family protein n=1 Tax=Promicromonospora sp. AC04 TaxID=2135723 RepID=UPI00351303FA
MRRPEQRVDVTRVRRRSRTSEATALESVRRELGVEDRDTAAIKDSEKDIGMLNWAADGFAVHPHHGVGPQP